MTTQTSLVAQQVRLQQWAEQIRDCQSRPKGVYDLLNCPILDYSNCPETAPFSVHNSSLISPEYSGDITLSNPFIKFFCKCLKTRRSAILLSY